MNRWMISPAWRASIYLSAVMFLYFGVQSAHAFVGILDESESTYTTSVSDHNGVRQFDINRNLITAPCRSNNLNNYHSYSYGYSYYTTFSVSTSYTDRKCGTSAAKHAYGIGDVKLTLRQRFNNYQDNFAWRAALIIPTGYDTTVYSRIGNGLYAVEGGLSFSTEKVFVKLREPAYWTSTLDLRVWEGKTQADTLAGSVKWHYRMSPFSSFTTGVDARMAFGGSSKDLLTNQLEDLPDSDAFVYRVNYTHDFSRELSSSFNLGKTFWGRNTTSYLSAGISLTYTWGGGL